MKELRCIVFSERELVMAVTDRRRRLGEPLPAGTVHSVRFSVDGTVTTHFTVEEDSGATSQFALSEAEVSAALVSYCMGRRVPLPADSEKILYVIKGAPTLMITMNFNKEPRLVPGSAERRRNSAMPALAGE